MIKKTIILDNYNISMLRACLTVINLGKKDLSIPILALIKVMSEQHVSEHAIQSPISSYNPKDVFTEVGVDLICQL
jgi:hypothetical protein